MYLISKGKCTCPKDLPYCICGAKSEGQIITRKPIIPTHEEQKENSRSTSIESFTVLYKGSISLFTSILIAWNVLFAGCPSFFANPGTESSIIFKSEGQIITRKPIIPTHEEQKENSRSRSAKLRVFEKI